MGRTDWDRILSINPSSLTDEDIEDFYPAIINCNVDEISNVANLQTILKVSQEILQYKDNQVESLLLECGELKEIVSLMKADLFKQKQYDKSSNKVDATTLQTVPQPREMSAFNTVELAKPDKIGTLIDELEVYFKKSI
ncbi:uncharacterized protein [Prorops nasuta]|uniref:uncharacterized protein n=1 Tax=Prorops nasuta TaxID=863751 RepID=UPI0034CDFA3F